MKRTPTPRPFSWAILATYRTARCATCCCEPVAANADGWGKAHCQCCPRGDAVRKVVA